MNAPCANSDCLQYKGAVSCLVTGSHRQAAAYRKSEFSDTSSPFGVVAVAVTNRCVTVRTSQITTRTTHAVATSAKCP